MQYSSILVNSEMEWVVAGHLIWNAQDHPYLRLIKDEDEDKGKDKDKDEDNQIQKNNK